MKYLLPILLLTGCAGAHKFAQIGDTQYFTVKAPSLLGPSINLIVIMKTNEPTPAIQVQASGNGILNSAVNAAGFVGGAAVFGHNMPSDQENVNIYGPQPAPATKAPVTIGNPSNDHPFNHHRH